MGGKERGGNEGLMTESGGRKTEIAQIAGSPISQKQREEIGARQKEARGPRASGRAMREKEEATRNERTG